MNTLNYLTLEEVLKFHDEMIDRFGGPAGVRDLSLLESALAQPEMAVFDNEVYKTIIEKAAAYIYFVIKNHPFIDGNKRTGLVCAIVFLKNNNIEVQENFESLYNFAIEVAASKIEFQEIIQYLNKHSVKHD
jgi:death-on-curing protein